MNNNNISVSSTTPSNYSNILNNRLEKRLKQLRKEYKTLESLKKMILTELSSSQMLSDRLSQIFEIKYTDKFKRPPSPFHFSKDKVPPLDEQFLSKGTDHLLHPDSVDISNFPKLLDLNEENYFKTADEIRQFVELQENDDEYEQMEEVEIVENENEMKISPNDLLLNENESNEEENQNQMKEKEN